MNLFENYHCNTSIYHASDDWQQNICNNFDEFDMVWETNGWKCELIPDAPDPHK